MKRAKEPVHDSMTVSMCLRDGNSRAGCISRDHDLAKAGAGARGGGPRKGPSMSWPGRAPHVARAELFDGVSSVRPLWVLEEKAASRAELL